MPFPEVCLNDKQHRPNEWPTLQLQQHACGTAVVYLNDGDNKPIELDESAHIVCISVVESMAGNKLILSKDLEITDALKGEVTLTVEPEDVTLRGLYQAEISLYLKEEEASSESGDSEESSSIVDPKLIRRFKAYVEIESAWDDFNSKPIGYTIAEIRLGMRDLSAQDNFLLDDVEYTNSEIAWAIRRPIEYWNESPPVLRRHVYSPANFPFRYEWLNAVKGELMVIASARYLRNHLPYQAAGLTVNDQDKYKQYQALGQNYIDGWKQWCMIKKKSINFQSCFGHIELSSYGNYDGANPFYGA